MNAHPRRGLPLRVDPNALAAVALTSLTRAVICSARAKRSFGGGNAQQILRTIWPDDSDAARLVTRAATTPTGSDATALARLAYALLAALVPMSAAADLIARSLQLSFDDTGQINVPGLTLPLANFVAERAPFPLAQGTSTATQIVPHKIGVIVELTREQTEGSNAEQIVRALLIENIGPSLDALMLSTTAGSAARPPGLLNGVAPLAPAAANKGDALVDDLAALATAVAGVAGNGGIVIVAAPAQAVAVALRALRSPYPLLTSASLAAGTVIALALPTLVTALDGPPEITSSSVATVHEETNPQPIATGAGTFASPVRSLMQTDSIGIRLRLQTSWALRSPLGIAWMQSVIW